MATERVKYWGLYDHWDGTWQSAAGVWQAAPKKRRRYDLVAACLQVRQCRGIQARPFYVVKRAKAPRLTPEANAVIDAAQAYVARWYRTDALHCTREGAALAAALEPFEKA